MHFLAGFLVLFGVFYFPLAEASRDVIEVSVEASSEAKSSSTAKQEIFKNAAESVSEDYIRQIIGNAKYDKNLSVIKSKIIDNSRKYILYMKSGPAKPKAGGREATVTMKISLKSLKQMLLAQGLLYQIEGPPKVLPLISYEDRVNGGSYVWWVDQYKDSDAFLKQQTKAFHLALRKQLVPKGFYVIESAKESVRNSLPETMRNAEAPTEDLLMLGDFFKSQLVVMGRIQIRQSPKRPDAFEQHIRVSAVHTSNGRVIGEVIRVFESQPGEMNVAIRNLNLSSLSKVAKDLTVQLYEAWKSGTFGSSLVRLAVKGPLSFQQIKTLKDELLTKLPDLKTLKERKFTPGEIVFEVDSGSSVQELVSKLNSMKFKPFQLQVRDWSSKQLDLKVVYN